MMAGMLGARTRPTSEMFFELFVRLWTFRYWIVSALNGLGHLGLAKSWPIRKRFRGYSMGAPRFGMSGAYRGGLY